MAGDVLTLFSAICYSIYTIFLKVKVPEEKEDTFNYTLFLGFVGLCNILLFIPFTLLLHFTEFETLEWPE